MQMIFYFCLLVVMACNLCCIFVMNLAKDGISTLIHLKRNVSHLEDGSCESDISPAVGKFYSQFNNIMAVLCKQKNEMAAVHLMTRGSAIAEEPRDAVRQLKYYGRFLTKLLTRSSANPQETCKHTVS